jgi:hypothetical protein
MRESVLVSMVVANKLWATNQSPCDGQHLRAGRALFVVMMWK